MTHTIEVVCPWGRKGWAGMVRTVLRVIALILCAITGLWALAHGIALIALFPRFPYNDRLQYLLEVCVSITGGISVLSVAVEQLYCWRTHRKEGGLM